MKRNETKRKKELYLHATSRRPRLPVGVGDVSLMWLVKVKEWWGWWHHPSLCIRILGYHGQSILSEVEDSERGIEDKFLVRSDLESSWCGHWWLKSRNRFRGNRLDSRGS